MIEALDILPEVTEPSPADARRDLIGTLRLPQDRPEDHLAEEIFHGQDDEDFISH